MKAWDKLRSGEAELALETMAEDCRDHPKDLSKAIQLGVAYMWLYEWEYAVTHFSDFIANYSWSTDVMSKMLGTAKWCSGRQEEAVLEWRGGLNVDYADVSGGITIPLHLHFAAANSDILSLDESERILREKFKIKDYIGYPALLALVALGDMEVEEAILVAKKTDPNGVKTHQWKISFWHGVSLLASGNSEDFLSIAKSVSDHRWEDYDKGKTAFVKKLWSTEFFLARNVVDFQSQLGGGVEEKKMIWEELPGASNR